MVEAIKKSEQSSFEWFNNIDELARRNVPFGEHFRRMAMSVHRFKLSDLNGVVVLKYESALRAHRNELLSKGNLNPKVRRYIERYIPW
jgi:hypothetical protein